MKLLKLSCYLDAHHTTYRNASVRYYTHNRLSPVLKVLRYRQEDYETPQTT